jgi:hypothetical protein
MKRLKSSYQDLHRIFDQSITVRDIAEPLASFDSNYPAQKAREFTEDRVFDVIGVRVDGGIRGFALAETLESGCVGDHLNDFKEPDVLQQNDSLLAALDALRDRRWAFVRFLGDPSGIVTRGDLQKPPMRMWLFGLISIFEMQMLRWIRDEYPKGSWEKYLTESRIDKARDLLQLRQERNEAIDLADCLQLSDKGRIFGKSDRLRELTKSQSNTQWQSYMDKLEEIRNSVAHGLDISSDMWPEIAERMDETVKNLIALENGMK